jgi:squalene cyclase
MNALEMAKQPEPDVTARLHAEFVSHLKKLQNADGGWGFHTGVQSRVEPTSWAARALRDSDKEFRKAAGFLQSKQHPDGSWPACEEMNSGSWVTSLTCAALSADSLSGKSVAAGLQWLCDDFPRDSSPWHRFLRRLRPQSHVAMNDSYRGWGWTPRTSSWVEPTAFALMALRDAQPRYLSVNAAERRASAIALLYDRMCPGGGWNCGNPRVYGVDGEALVLSTCWALLALRDAPEKPGRPLSLGWLQKAFEKIESAGSLAVARMTLENYGIETPPSKHHLRRWTAQDLAEEGTHVLAWVCLALDPARRWPAVANKDTPGHLP